MKQNLCTHTESFRRNTIVYINWDEGMHRTHYAYHITIYVVDRTTYNDIVRYGFAKLYVYCIQSSCIKYRIYACNMKRTKKTNEDDECRERERERTASVHAGDDKLLKWSMVWNIAIDGIMYCCVATHIQTRIAEIACLEYCIDSVHTLLHGKILHFAPSFALANYTRSHSFVR